jgi:hypothetical protein
LRRTVFVCNTMVLDRVCVRLGLMWDRYSCGPRSTWDCSSVGLSLRGIGPLWDSTLSWQSSRPTYSHIHTPLQYKQYAMHQQTNVCRHWNRAVEGNQTMTTFQVIQNILPGIRNHKPFTMEVYANRDIDMAFCGQGLDKRIHLLLYHIQVD